MSLRFDRRTIAGLVLALVGVGCGGSDARGSGEDQATSETAAPATSDAPVTSTTVPPATTSEPATSESPATTRPTTTVVTGPEWAPPGMTTEQADVMLGLVEGELLALELDFTIDEGVVVAGDSQYGLFNLAATLLDTPTSDWKAAIAHHFEAVFDAQSSDTVPSDWSEVSPSVRLRMKGTEELESYPIETFAVELAEGLWAVPVFDTPTAALTITPEDADEWGVDGETLHEVGRPNTIDNVVVDYSVTDALGFPVGIATGDFYSGTLVFDIESIAGPLTPGVGALVAVPTGDVLLVAPISSQAIIGHLFTFAVVTEGFWSDGPGSASPLVYWYRDGELRRLNFEFDEDQGAMLNDLEFVEMIDGLPQS